MPKSDTYFKIEENSVKNAILLDLLKKYKLSVSELARRCQVNKSIISLALRNKYISKIVKIKIAKYFGMDTLELFD